MSTQRPAGAPVEARCQASLRQLRQTDAVIERTEHRVGNRVYKQKYPHPDRDLQDQRRAELVRTSSSTWRPLVRGNRGQSRGGSKVGGGVQAPVARAAGRGGRGAGADRTAADGVIGPEACDETSTTSWMALRCGAWAHRIVIDR